MNQRRQIRNLDKKTLEPFLLKSDFLAWRMVVVNFGIILGALLVPVWLGSVYAYIISLVILANRQLGLAILMHDASHQALFHSKKLNEVLGRWLFGAPIFADLDRYRTYHLEHHRTAGSSRDPDRSNYISYPVGRESMVRKILRDISGITGIKTLILLWKMNSGEIAYQLSYAQHSTDAKLSQREKIGNALWGLRRSIAFYLVFFYLCYQLNLLECFVLWGAAFLSPYMLISRIRNAAEHAVTENVHSLDPMLNTRTTRTGILGRMTFAPNYVNYHLEHHLLPQIPPYHLKELHHHLHQVGFLGPEHFTPGYTEVFRKLIGETPIKAYGGVTA